MSSRDSWWSRQQNPQVGTEPLHDPGPYVEAGMTVMDLGCGPGFFSIEMAKMVGASGEVIAADLQDGMLQLLRRKIACTTLGDRITLHKC